MAWKCNKVKLLPHCSWVQTINPKITYRLRILKLEQKLFIQIGTQEIWENRILRNFTNIIWKFRWIFWLVTRSILVLKYATCKLYVRGYYVRYTRIKGDSEILLWNKNLDDSSKVRATIDSDNQRVWIENDL